MAVVPYMAHCGLNETASYRVGITTVPAGDTGVQMPSTLKVKGRTCYVTNRTKLTAIETAVGKEAMITMGCGKA
jgi:hypothetical protein